MRTVLIVLLATMVVGASRVGAGDVDIDKLVANTEAFLTELDAYEELSLAVMIARDGDPVLAKAYGLANRSFGVANQIDTKFHLASMNKMFTAVAILQLVQRGRLKLDNTVGVYIPDYPNDEVRDHVTVHQLLTHTAGLGSMFGERYDRIPVNRFQTVDDYLPLFVDEALQFPPGSRYQYSNAGYVLLGHLLERATVQDYHSFVRENVFVPAGMNDTDCYDVQYPVPNLAIGYNRLSSGAGVYDYRTIEYMKMTKGGPAGGGYSTVGDLVRFGEALFDHRLLDSEHTALATTGKVEVDDIWQGGEYCYGFLEQRINGHRILGHSGNFAGTRTTLKVYVDDGLSLAILSNFDRDQGAEELEYFIREQINGETKFTRRYLGTRRIIRRVEQAGVDAGLQAYERLPKGTIPYERMINGKGYFRLRRREYDRAIVLFRFNVQAFPHSANALDSLAEAYLRKGDEKRAIEYYRKVLALDPNFRSAREALGRLEAPH